MNLRIPKGGYLFLAIVFSCQIWLDRSEAQMSSQVSHAEHMLSRLHDNYIAETTVNGLAPAEKVYLVIWRMEFEVYNGGFLQFFMNSSGLLVPHLGSALRTVSANDALPIVEEAIAIVGPDVPWNDDAKRWQAVKNLSSEARDRIWALDKRLGEHLGELSILLLGYVSRNRDQFGMSEDFWREAVPQ
jgi:hypothetical protein